MKKNLTLTFYFLLSLILIQIYSKPYPIKAFIPRINEPNQKELELKSIQIRNKAIQYIQFGQVNEAIKLLELAVKLNPQEYTLWTMLAETQIISNKEIEAIVSLNKAIQLKPNKEETYFTKGSIYMNLNKPKQAILAIKKGLTLNSKNERGYFQLGNAEIMQKNYKSALIAFKKSSKINSNFWQSINNEGLILYELNNPKKAISCFRLALKISKNAEPMLALAIVLFSSEDNSKESIMLAKNALISNPKYVSTEYQSSQLWGEKLQKAGQVLFNSKEMIRAVEEAKEKSK
tara:strand:- start:3 stop:872 length:870 start_codon:yes stop_codon:yes gene_type:complete